MTPCRPFVPATECPPHGQNRQKTEKSRQARRAAGMEPATTSIPASTARNSNGTWRTPRPTASPSSTTSRASCKRWRRGRMPAKALAAAVKRYEALDDTLGRVMSYASLNYAGNTTDPVRAKFYGDMQERITAASMHVLFFTLELNRVDDAALDAAMADPALGHYRPWIEDVRKEKPYQLEDRVEELFHEKSVTGYSAWNRQYDETIAGLRFKIGGKALLDRAGAQLLQDADGKKRKKRGAGAGQDLQGQLAAVHADHQHARQGQGNLRPLARLQGRGRLPPSRQPRRAGSGGGAGVGRARRLSEAVAPLLRIEGEMVRQEVAALLGPQRAAAQGRATHDPVVGRARDRAHRLWRVLAQDGGGRRPLFREALDRRGRARRQAAGRLRASDRAVGASLRAAQLPGQAARRDDAGARTRPWRAPGAGGAERCADGADAADAGGDRERVRRNAHLQEAARRRSPTRSSAKPCSPPRSRT